MKLAMKLPCHHLIHLLLQQQKDIFVAKLIRERWTKKYNCSEYQNVATSSENTEVEVLKYVEVSPAM